MTYCDFQTELKAGAMYFHRCRREGCGRTFQSPAPRQRVLCRVQLEAVGQVKPARVGSPLRPPTLVRQAASFVSAEARWIAAGRPVRSEEQVEVVFGICRTCEHFRAGATELEGSCGVCGCRLRRVGGLFNKIQMATEGCPDKPPRWAPEELSSAKSSTAVAEA